METIQERILPERKRQKKKRTRSSSDVVEGELSDSGVELEKEGERLANATGGTEDGDLGKLQSASMSVSSHIASSNVSLELGAQGASHVSCRSREGTALDPRGHEHCGWWGYETEDGRDRDRMDLVLPQSAEQSDEIWGDGGYQQKSRDFVQSGNFQEVR